MTDKVAKILSGIFHPFLITLYSFILIFISGSYITYLPNSIKLIILTVILFNTLLIPILSLLILKKLGLIKSFYMEKHKERIVPIIITSIPYVFTLYLLARLPVPPVLIKIIEGGVMVLLFSAIISYWWKISLHLMGLGGLTGFLLACSYNNYFDAIFLIIISFLIAGFLSAARLKNGDHTPSQVYVGFLLGFCLVFFFFL